MPDLVGEALAPLAANARDPRCTGDAAAFVGARRVELDGRGVRTHAATEQGAATVAAARAGIGARLVLARLLAARDLIRRLTHQLHGTGRHERQRHEEGHAGAASHASMMSQSGQRNKGAGGHDGARAPDQRMR